jgi:formylglycine-generating enzyme required for sulfatase activity
LGVFEVTQAQYEQVMTMNPGCFKGPRHPVEMVSWNDAVTFCNQLSALAEEKAAGRMYRLPTDAEWEYACRAGTTTRYYFGDRAAKLGEYAWFGGSDQSEIDWFGRRGENTQAIDQTQPVGQKKPNAWGLYDMYGNVWEWCQDLYWEGSLCACRGGSWYSLASNCQTELRIYHRPDSRYNFLGFRVATVPSASQANSASPASGAESGGR